LTAGRLQARVGRGKGIALIQVVNGPGWIASELEALARPSILLVEDDNDICELLSTLLRLAGYKPTACRSAEEGLECLREQQFDLVLTDYMLPIRTGGWLIQQAEAEGLLEATPALLVTAHPNPTEAKGVEVIQKPFDLDDLVDRIKQKLEAGDPARPARRKRAGSTRSPGFGSSGHRGEECPDPIELILYVSSQSPRSASALEDIQKVLTRYKSSRVKLTIHDLSKDPTQGGADAIALTPMPTLVRKSPGPRTFILGHITNPELLLELLESCEEG
jgi:CheY-like chemotaxis protein